MSVLFHISNYVALVQEPHQPQIGDITEHGVVMRLEKLTVQDFIIHAMCGGLPLHGYDQILIDERFVTSASQYESDDGGIPSIIGGHVTLLWINYLLSSGI